MATILVALFDDFNSAQSAASELATIGINPAKVSITRNQPDTGYITHRAESVEPISGKNQKGGIAGFFENLFGSDIDEEDRGLYAEAVRRGSAVLTAQVDDSYIERASDVLERFGSIDISRRAAQYATSGYTGYKTAAPAYTAEQTRAELERFGSEGEVAVPIVEEQLKVGKRQVQRGGVRVYSRVTERPVEERVDLREEHVIVDRRPVDRAASEADVAALGDSEIVVTETAEEAVVAKEARVVEEVVVSKATTQRTETVRDTVRRTEVEVEQMSDVAADTNRSRKTDRDR
jgi:uncharacterized protein (TIGR02271 family)